MCFDGSCGLCGFCTTKYEKDCYRTTNDLDLWKRRVRGSVQLWGGSTSTGTPALQHVGMRVTAQTIAAPATEELWSEYDFVVNQRRTSLLMIKGRAEKLVRVHANARMRGLDYSENYVSQLDSCSRN